MKSRFGLLVALVIGILTALRVFSPAPATYTPRPGDVMQIVFAPNTELPFLVTRGGDLFHPSGDAWMNMQVGMPVNDVFVEFSGTMFAGTNEGLLRYRDAVWEPVPNVPPTDDLESMHGFLFAMGKTGVARSGESSTENDAWRILKMPLPDAPVGSMVMLGDHSHIVLNGSLIQTNDMGLSWTILPPPGEVHRMANDALDNLLVAVDDGIYRWAYQDKVWSKIAPLPDNRPPDRMLVYNGEVVTLANGRLYKLEKGAWTAISIAGAGYLTTMAVQQQSRLWLADGENNQLWYSDNGIDWTSKPFTVLDDPGFR